MKLTTTNNNLGALNRGSDFLVKQIIINNRDKLNEIYRSIRQRALLEESRNEA